MWKRKTKPEIEKSIIESNKNTRKHQVKYYFVLSIMSFILQFVGHKTGFRGSRESSPMSWSEVIEIMPQMVLISLSLLLVLYVFKVKVISEDKLYICPNCNSKKNNIKRGIKCECGGEYVDMDLLKWVDDETLEEKKNDNQQKKIATEQKKQ